MAIDIGVGSQANNDELGSEPTVRSISKVKTDSTTIEVEPFQSTKTSEGHVWIAGSSTNAIVGTWTGTGDGQQLVVGPDGDGGRTPEILRVININNIVIQRFELDYTKSTSSTCDWNTTNGRLAHSTGLPSASPLITIGQSTQVYKDATTITKVRVSATEVKYSSDVIQYYVSTDGSTWQEITLNTETTLTTPGTELYWRVVFTGFGRSSTYITKLLLDYD